ncbi:FAD-binding domain-containing protein [Candidatus Planktophila dulcis]|uniref:FAD-binding domain-containing protein n=1 Tax=Candidatus Planktophila dulcis TaxID=1884914 RepID=UPI003BEF4444
MKQIDISLDASVLLEKEFIGLHSGGGRSSIVGGQSAADAALAALDIAGYAKNRSEILPLDSRGASRLSPYIRHNLLPLQRVWDHVAKAPFGDREKYRDELMWQEYARHLYARIGTRLFENLRFEQVWDREGNGWPEGMACVDFATNELQEDGWLVNQSRMWLASHWTVRNEFGWLHGQEQMYRHLLDGSRAANLLGWQWTVGAGTGKPYGFARWQVQKRASELCMGCALKKSCPIEEFPAEITLEQAPFASLLGEDPDISATTGPIVAQINSIVEVVLLTVDSLGDADPALVANPELPVVFVFNDAALAKLQLSSKRIYFYLETLQDLATRRDVSIYIGNPYDYAREHAVAVTYAPVPSFAKFEKLAQVHPFLWLRKPHAKSVRSFSAWRGKG